MVIIDQRKVPPSNQNMEADLLATLLKYPEEIPDIRSVLPEEAFYNHEHCKVYRALIALDELGDLVDITTATEWLRRNAESPEDDPVRYWHDTLHSMGFSSDLGQLRLDPRAAASKAKALRALWKARQIRNFGMFCGQETDEAPEDVEALVSELRRQLEEIDDDGATEGFEPAPGLAARVAADLIELAEGTRESDGFSFGLRDLDEFVGGLRPGELCVVAARPSMGKSAFAMQVCAKVAVELGQPTAVCSLEMRKEKLMQRLLANMASVDLLDCRRGLGIGYKAKERLEAKVGDLDKAPILWHDSGRLSAQNMRAFARRAKARHGLGLVMIDYLQLMDTEREESRAVEIGRITRAAKELAVEFNIPVLLLSQLNRGVDGRDDKQPRMSDLRDSGRIEEDADVVLLLWRPEYYDKGADHRRAFVAVGKNREGSAGAVVPLRWVREHTRFEDWPSQ